MSVRVRVSTVTRLSSLVRRSMAPGLPLEAVEGELVRALDAWRHRHRECGPGCIITGDDCEDDIIILSARLVQR